MRYSMKGSLTALCAVLCLFVFHQLHADAVNYTYDNAGRLIKADYGDCKTIEYTYDKAGNLLKREMKSGEPLVGDVSGNCEITAYDASLILQAVVGLIPLPLLQVADVTGDGTISALDAAYILQYNVGLIDEFSAEPDSKILAYRTLTRQLTLLPLADYQTGQIIMPISIDEAQSCLAYDLSISYDPEILEIQEVRKINQDDLIEYQVTKGKVKIVLARTEPIQGRKTEMILVGALQPNRKTKSVARNEAISEANTVEQASLSLSDFQINEGSIPVDVSVLEQPMKFNKIRLEGTSDKPLVSIPIHYVTPTSKQEYFYSFNSTFQGEPLKRGDVILARDADGVLCGYCVVENEGEYGYMTVYGDDVWTQLDEGAGEGEELTFYINGYRAGSAGLDVPVWMGQWGRQEVDLFTWVTRIPLSEGWNFVSFDLQPHQSSVAEVLESIEGKYEVVIAANGTPYTFDPELKEYSALHQLLPFQEYWLKLKEPAPLFITGVPSQELTPQVSQLRATSELNFVDFWGEIFLFGQPALEGTVITASNRAGVELGRCVVNDAGKYGFLHIVVDETLSDFTYIRFQVEGILVPLDYFLPNLSPSKGSRIHFDIEVE